MTDQDLDLRRVESLSAADDYRAAALDADDDCAAAYLAAASRAALRAAMGAL